MTQYQFTPPGTIEIREPERRFSCGCDSQPCSCHTLPTGAAFHGLLEFRCSRARSVRFQPCQVSTGSVPTVSRNFRISGRRGVISVTGSPGSPGSHANCRPPRCPSMTRTPRPQPCGHGRDRMAANGNAQLLPWQDPSSSGCVLRRPFSGNTAWKRESRPGRTMGGSIPTTPNPGCRPGVCAVTCLPTAPQTRTVARELIRFGQLGNP